VTPCQQRPDRHLGRPGSPGGSRAHHSGRRAPRSAELSARAGAARGVAVATPARTSRPQSPPASTRVSPPIIDVCGQRVARCHACPWS